MKRLLLPAVLLLLHWQAAVAQEGQPRPENRKLGLPERLQDPNTRVVQKALGELRWARRWRKLEVKQQIIQLVDSKSPEEREAAINVLRELGPPGAEALPALTGRLADSHPDVRLSAAAAIWSVGRDQRLPMPVLLEAIQSHEETSVYRAAMVLQEMGPAASGALEALVALTSSERKFTRLHALNSLGSLGPSLRSRVEPSLQTALDDSEKEVRIAAARAINRVDGTLDKALHVLAKLLAEKSSEPPKSANTNPLGGPNSAAAAASALGEFEGDALPVVQELTQALASPSLMVRLNAAAALGRVGPAAADSVPSLGKALRESEGRSMPFVHRVWCVGDNAAKALQQIGEPAVPVLLEALRDKDAAVREDAARALAGLPGSAPRTVAPLSRRLLDPHPLVRIEAARAIRQFGPAGRSAASNLAYLLNDDRAFTSYRAGMGIGRTESVRREALNALLKLKPSADQVSPALVQTLKRAEEVPYEVIAAIRAFKPRDASAKRSLQRLLADEEVATGAAAALAFIDPRGNGLREVLERKMVDKEGKLNADALLGLGQLASSGETFDPVFRKRLTELAAAQRDLFAWSCLLRMAPDDRAVASSLIDTLQTSHRVFKATGIREAERSLRELATHASVRAALLKALRERPENPIKGDYDRLQAARLLVLGGGGQQPSITALDGVAAGDNPTAQGGAADVLARCLHERKAAIAVLLKLLQVNKSYVVGGDFYGNGGERRYVGDRAARALIALEALPTLQNQLTNKDTAVRLRVIRALGGFGGRAIDVTLLDAVKDVDFHIRREAVRTLERIASADPETRERLRPVLQSAARNDRRRSVRFEAAKAIRDWR